MTLCRPSLSLLTPCHRSLSLSSQLHVTQISLSLSSLHVTFLSIYSLHVALLSQSSVFSALLCLSLHSTLPFLLSLLFPCRPSLSLIILCRPSCLHISQWPFIIAQWGSHHVLLWISISKCLSFRRKQSFCWDFMKKTSKTLFSRNFLSQTSNQEWLTQLHCIFD